MDVEVRDFVDNLIIFVEMMIGQKLLENLESMCMYVL